MAIYDNPYGDDSYDLDAARRKALLDLMGTPDQDNRRTIGEPGPPGQYMGTTPTPSQTLPSSRQAPASGFYGPARSTAAGGADTPDLPDPTPSTPAAPPAPANPYATGDGRQAGTKILDLYDDPYTRRQTYGGSDPKRQAIASALVSSGNPYAMAAGAVGYLDAWLHRKADSAPTDFSLEDATQIIKDAYRDMNGGREISDQELNDALAGQGLRSGSHWVGQSGLQGVLGHLAQNAAFTRAQGGNATPPSGAGTAASTAAAGATPGGPLASNPNTGVAGGMSTGVSGPSGSTGGGGVPAGVEGVDPDKWKDPNKHDLKYDALHTIVDAGSVDAAWPKLQQMYPNAQRIGGDVIDFDGPGGEPPIDVQRDSDHGGPFHWEPVDGSSSSAASAAPASVTSSPVTLPGAAQLAAPLTNNNVLQQIMEQLRRVQAGEPPRAEILNQMGGA